MTSFLAANDGQLSPNPNSPTIGTGGIPISISINAAGTKMYVAGRDGSAIDVYDIAPSGQLTPILESP